MPECAFRSCKNNSRSSNSQEVSYFRFPTNPFTCEEWVTIVEKERGDKNYLPAKNSVICSDHFCTWDMSDKTTNRRRLIKTAIPKLKIKPSSADPQPTSPFTNPSTSDKEVQPPTFNSGLDITQNSTCEQEQVKPRISIEISYNTSDTVAPRYTPKEAFLRRKLLHARKIIDNKTKKIKLLQKVNKRLLKKSSSLKNIVKLLKKKDPVDYYILY